MTGSRRRWLGSGLAGTLVVALVLLVGCGGDDDGGSEGGGGSTGGAERLVVAVPDDAVSFDMFFALSLTSGEVVMNAYDAFTTYEFTEEDGIMTWDPSRNVGFGLEELEVSEDGKIWTLRLREGAKFANGDPITSADVKYMMDRNFGVEGSAAKFLYEFLGRIASPDSIKIVDDLTVEVTTTTANPLLPHLFTLSNSVIPNSKVLQENAGEDGWAREFLDRNTAGGGPYQVESWTPGSQVVLAANENYWAGAPTIKEVVLRIVPSAASRVALLQRGEVDLAERLSPAEVETLEGVDDVNVVSVPGSGQLLLVMNNKEAPFDDVRVRQAMQFAVPYQQIIDTVYRGFAQPTAGPVPVNFPAHDGTDYPYGEQDLDRARELLAEAGHPDGFTVDLALSTGNPNHEPAAVLIKDALSQIGVTVNIQTLTPAVFAEQSGQKTLTFFLHDLLWWVPDPAYAMALGYACEQFFNYANYCNEEMQAQLDTAFTETDEAARQQMFADLQRLIWEDSPVVWIAQPNVNLAMRSNVSGYRHMNDELLRFQYLTKE